MDNAPSSRFGSGFLCGSIFGITIAIAGVWLAKQPRLANLPQNSDGQHEQTARPFQKSEVKVHSVQATPSEFDAHDLERTVSWTVRLMTEFERVSEGNNAMATRSARVSIYNELKKIVGSSVNWQLPIEKVGDSCVKFQCDFGRYNSRTYYHVSSALRLGVKHNKEFAVGPFDDENLNFMIGDEVGRADATSLLRGDLVDVRGTVSSADFVYVGGVDFGEKIVLFLSDISVTVAAKKP